MALDEPSPISKLDPFGFVPASTDLVPAAIWDANKLGPGVGGWRTHRLTMDQLATALQSVQADLSDFIISVETGGLPDPLLGQEGQFAIRFSPAPTTFWKKVTGVWTLVSTLQVNELHLQGSRAALAAFNPDPTAAYIRTAGYYAVGDGGGALYKRVAVQPTHAGKVQALDGSWWEFQPEGIVNVLQFGADPTGATASSTFAQNAADYLHANPANAGLLYFPPGFYLLPAGLTTLDGIRLVGAGINATTLFCGPNDVNTVTLASSHSWIEHMSVYGKGSGFGGAPETFGATKSALKISGHANCVRVWYGLNALEVTGVDCTFFNVNAGNAYGSANVTTNGACWYVRNIFDHSPTGIALANAAPFAARANSTAYTVGQVRSLSGYLIQVKSITGGGLSGGAPPALKNYGVDIVDSQVTWLLLAPVDFAGMRITTGAGENHFVQTDWTGNGYAHSIVIDAVNSFTKMTNCVLNAPAELTTGSITSMRDCSLGGDINIAAGMGISIVAGNTALSVININVAANAQNFHIFGNYLGSCNVVVAAGTSNNYVVAFNFGSHTITDNGSGASKLVFGPSPLSMFNAIKQSATPSVSGVVAMSTAAQSLAGTDAGTAVSPSVIPNQICRMHRAAGFTQNYNGSFVKIPMDTVTFDTPGTLADVASGQIKINRAGRYLVTAQFYISGQAAAQNVDAAIAINGATRSLSRVVAGPGGDGSATTTDTYDLAVNDTVALFASATINGNLTTQTTSFLQPRLSVVQIK